MEEQSNTQLTYELKQVSETIDSEGSYKLDPSSKEIVYKDTYPKLSKLVEEYANQLTLKDSEVSELKLQASRAVKAIEELLEVNCKLKTKIAQLEAEKNSSKGCWPCFLK